MREMQGSFVDASEFNGPAKEIRLTTDQKEARRLVNFDGWRFVSAMPRPNEQVEILLVKVG